MPESTQEQADTRPTEAHHAPQLTTALNDSPVSVDAVRAPSPMRGVQEGFDLVEMRVPEGHALYLKGRVSGRIYRFSLARDPVEARSWCLFVEHCAAVGTVGRRIDGVIGPGHLTREEAQTALREISANPTKWLGHRSRQRLLAWIRAASANEELAATR